INASTGALSFAGAPDYETPTDAGANNVYDVIVQASDGTLSSSQAIAVSVTDVASTLVVTTAADNNDSGIAIGASFTNEWLNAHQGADNAVSLREAIIAANNTTGADTISFNIAGTTPHTITLTSALPAITGAVTLDATTDDSFAANGNRPAIVLDGNGLNVNGLQLASGSGGSTIRGFVVTNLLFSGIRIDAGSNGNTIAGNYVGKLTAAGGAGSAGTGTGIAVYGNNNTIGGTTAADRNVVGGNTSDGIGVDAVNGGGTGNQVLGNYVGIDASGIVALGNGVRGVELRGGAINNTVGGAAAGAGNVIGASGIDGIRVTGETSDGNQVLGNWIGIGADGSTLLGNNSGGVSISAGADNAVINANWIVGNGGRGIFVGTSSSGLVVQGNRIGTDASGTLNLGNGRDGIYLGSSVSGNLIGGSGAGQGNIIAYSNQSGGAFDGIGIDSAAGSANTLLGNLVYGTNAGLGINIIGGSENAAGVTANDTGDGDTGPNSLQNFPVLASAKTNGSQITVSGTLNSVASSAFRIELFASASANASGYGEGQRFIGFANVTTNASGNASFTTTLSATVAVGESVSATATLSNGTFTTFTNTSEFALGVAATSSAVITSNGGGATAAVSVPETATAVTTVAATGSGITYSISGGADAARFTINSATGVLSFTLLPDFEAPSDAGANNVYDVTVLASGGSLSTTQAIAVTVTNANEAPMIGSAGGGKVSADFAGGQDDGYAVAVQSDGKVVVAGDRQSGSFQFALTRWNADGTLDTTFGGTGKVSTTVGSTNAYAFAVTVQTDGKIIAAGYSVSGNQVIALVRYNADGSLDAAFGTGGIVRTTLGTNPSARALAVQGDGKIVVAGSTTVSGVSRVALVRYNADGSLDTSFGTGGTLTTAVGSGSGAMGMALRADGRIVVAGWGSNGSNNDFAVLRYNADGSLDTSFNGTGQVTTSLGASDDMANAVALQGDGKIVTAGQTSNGATNNFALVRYNIDGSLDTGFNGTGMVSTDFSGQNDYAYSVAVAGDGSIVAMGEARTGSRDFAIARYRSDGSLDTRFNGTGQRTIDFSGSTDYGGGGALMPDGRIVVAGTPTVGGSFDMGAARVNVDGSLDASFGGMAPIVYTENGSASVLSSSVSVFDPELSSAGNYAGATLTLARAGGADALDQYSATGALAALTPGANLVYAGTTIGTVTSNSAGTLVLSFNASATQTLVNNALRAIAYSNSSDTPPASVRIDWSFNDGNGGAQGSGGALAGTGYTTVNITAVNDAPLLVPAAPTLASIHEDETGNAGQTVASFASASVSDPDGMGLPYGIAITATTQGNGAWQYSIDGGASWSKVGVVSATNALLLRSTDGIRFVPDGLNGTSASITYRAWDQTSGSAGARVDASTSTGGSTAFSTSTDTASITVTAVNDAPTFDAGTGVATLPRVTGADIAESMLLQPDGRIIAIGRSMVPGNNFDFVAVRYLADGALDTSFGTGGVVTIDIAGGSDQAYGAALQADGKIVLAGYARVGGTDDIALVRLNADGSLDTSFSGDGKLTYAIGLGHDNAYDVAVQTDGKIVVAATVVSGNRDVALLRFNADGTLDGSFGAGGVVTTAVGPGDDQARSLVIQDDGKLLVTGYASNGTNDDFMLVRYLTNGSLDTSFSGDGRLTTAIGAGPDRIRGVMVQEDGRIVVVGSSSNGVNEDIAIARYLTDGTIDGTFGVGGIVTQAIGPGIDQAFDVQTDSTGRIVVAGYASNGTNVTFALLRYDATGVLDAGFGNGGIRTAAVGTVSDVLLGLAIRPDGKIVAVGATDTGTASSFDIAVARFTADGELDTRFAAVDTLDGAPTYVENGAAVVLDANVEIFDHELAAAGHYAGATLTLSRNGGASVNDLFSATGALSALTAGDALVLSGVTIGTITTNSGGTLMLTFDGNATQARVNEALRGIAYANASDAPPASVQIDWTFDDGNTGAQGSGGARGVTGSTTVGITAVNDAPVITSDGGGATASMNVTENTTAVTTVAATDADGPGLTYSISGGADAILFTLDATTGALSFATARDYENPTDVGGDNVYDVIVQVSDGAAADTQVIAVTVTDTDEFDVGPVTDGNATTNTVTENAANGTAVGITASASDGDGSTNAITYALTDDAAGRFVIDAGTGVVTVANGSLLDYESALSHQITVRATSADGSFSEENFTIAVANANDSAPQITSDGGGATTSVNVTENTTAVTTVTATDADSPVLVYGIAGGVDSARFSIDATTGQLTFMTAPDHENPADTGSDNVYDVAVQVSDGTWTDTQSIAVTVTDVNEMPVIISDGGTATAALAVVQQTVAVTTVAAADPDQPAQMLTYAIVGGVDAAHFAIDAGTGALTFVAPPVHAAPIDADADNVYEVLVAASDGQLSSTQMLSVSVSPPASAGGGPPPGPAIPPSVEVVKPVPLPTVPPTTPSTPTAPASPGGPAGGSAAAATIAAPSEMAGGMVFTEQSSLTIEALVDRRVAEAARIAPVRFTAHWLEMPPASAFAEEFRRDAVVFRDYLLNAIADSGSGSGSFEELTVEPFALPVVDAEQTTLGMVLAGGFVASAGLLIWASRGGALLSSLLVSSPAWRGYDLLPVLRQDQKEHDWGDDVADTEADRTIRRRLEPEEAAAAPGEQRR
ncbi:MAG: cadherin domain-containing protein, partial [Burkholderiales bacterium]|nr:cadherin domain-containing protein [Burkholderiales bacterium]